MGNRYPHWHACATGLCLIAHVPNYLQRAERGRDLGAPEEIAARVTCRISNFARGPGACRFGKIWRDPARWKKIVSLSRKSISDFMPEDRRRDESAPAFTQAHVSR